MNKLEVQIELLEKLKEASESVCERSFLNKELENLYRAYKSTNGKPYERN